MAASTAESNTAAELLHAVGNGNMTEAEAAAEHTRVMTAYDSAVDKIVDHIQGTGRPRA